MNRKLYRSRENRVWSGIIGGIGEYLDINPVILRVAWVVFVVFTGFSPGLIAYLVSLVVVPERID